MTDIRPRRLPALAPHATDHLVEHLVLAIDGGPAAAAATRWVGERARSHVIDADLVHVVPDGTGGIAADGTPRADGPIGPARRHLARVAPAVEVTARVLEGEPLQVLAACAVDADLVVLGTHRGAGSPHLVAAFATRFAASAPCPGVVVPAGWRRSAGPIVCGVEGDGSDVAAVEFAAREAAVLHRELVLVHSWRLAPVVWPALEVDLEGHAIPHGPSARLDAVADPLRKAHPELQVVRVVEHGAAVRALLRAGRHASLLVLGTHGVSLIDRLLLGSVTRGVLERPVCPVAIVPPHRAD
ncbi:MAG: universal stress protein [Acidobacteria bacterium]|nr:universal stress protein [Acidobacteriota bacterium]